MPALSAHTLMSSNCLHDSPPEAGRTEFALLDEVPERVRHIAMLRGLGYSYRQIAAPLKVTPQAVALMLARHRQSLKSLRGAAELGSLSARAVNALGRHGIRTRKQARLANLPVLLAGERNCGRKTVEEIIRWLREEAGSNGDGPAPAGVAAGTHDVSAYAHGQP